MNGRQLCWLLRERFKADRNQEIYKAQEVHVLKLIKDNIPAYLTALDGLLLDLTLPADTMELLFTAQIETSEQCKKTLEEYHYEIQKGNLEPSYAHLRKEGELHIEILKKRDIKKEREIRKDCSRPQGRRCSSRAQ